MNPSAVRSFFPPRLNPDWGSKEPYSLGCVCYIEPRAPFVVNQVLLLLWGEGADEMSH
jgi:hypothetical protein